MKQLQITVWNYEWKNFKADSSQFSKMLTSECSQCRWLHSGRDLRDSWCWHCSWGQSTQDHTHNCSQLPDPVGKVINQTWWWNCKRTLYWRIKVGVIQTQKYDYWYIWHCQPFVVIKTYILGVWSWLFVHGNLSRMSASSPNSSKHKCYMYTASFSGFFVKWDYQITMHCPCTQGSRAQSLMLSSQIVPL